MDIEEIRSSGLLELYVLDQLSPAERAELETHFLIYPQLKSDLIEIEKSLEFFASGAGIPGPEAVKNQILESLKGSFKNNGSHIPTGNVWPAVASVLGLVLLILGYLFYQKNENNLLLEREMDTLRDTCQTRTNDLTKQLDLLRQLNQPSNKILAFQATPGFASTDLYLFTNKVTKRNFIQVSKLPPLSGNQSFELWSIKPGLPPEPLNVFGVPDTGLIEVAYVEGTQVYAITIEPKGGKQSPTMENLIGTVNVGGI